MSLEKIPCERCVETPEEVHHDRAELRRTLARECRARQAAEARERVFRQRYEAERDAHLKLKTASDSWMTTKQIQRLRERLQEEADDRAKVECRAVSAEIERDRLKLRIVELEAGK